MRPTARDVSQPGHGSARRDFFRLVEHNDIRLRDGGANAGGLHRDKITGTALMPQGTIKKLVADKGFGFIAGDSGDLFFHLSALEDGQFEDLEIGQTVEYEEGEGPKGPRATSVKPA